MRTVLWEAQLAHPPRLLPVVERTAAVPRSVSWKVADGVATPRPLLDGGRRPLGARRTTRSEKPKGQIVVSPVDVAACDVAERSDAVTLHA